MIFQIPQELERVGRAGEGAQQLTLVGTQGCGHPGPHTRHARLRANPHPPDLRKQGHLSCPSTPTRGATEETEGGPRDSAII